MHDINSYIDFEKQNAASLRQVAYALRENECRLTKCKDDEIEFKGRFLSGRGTEDLLLSLVSSGCIKANGERVNIVLSLKQLRAWLALFFIVASLLRFGSIQKWSLTSILDVSLYLDQAIVIIFVYGISVVSVRNRYIKLVKYNMVGNH